MALIKKKKKSAKQKHVWEKVGDKVFQGLCLDSAFAKVPGPWLEAAATDREVLSEVCGGKGAREEEGIGAIGMWGQEQGEDSQGHRPGGRGHFGSEQLSILGR